MTRIPKDQEKRRNLPAVERSLASHLTPLGLFLVAVSLAACDSLLEADLPGALVSEDLNDPRLAETLVLGAQADFDCVYDNHVEVMGFWTGEFYATDNAVWLLEPQHRLTPYWETRWGDGTCEEERAHHSGLQTARVQAKTAVEFVQGFEGMTPSEQNFLVGTALAYEGWSIQLLAEDFCQVVFDGGVPLSREDGYREARDRFSQAIELLGGVTGSRAGEANTYRYASLNGRARANLMLGELGSVTGDASQIPEGFVLEASYNDAIARTYNNIYWQSNIDFGVILSWEYAPGQHGGMPVPEDAELLGIFKPTGEVDPRVPMIHEGLGVGFDAFSDIWVQGKYLSRSASIPVTSWEESQLMIAEVEGGQRAVGIINMLRDRYPELAPFDFASNDEVEIQAQVRLERKKELFLEGTRMADQMRWDEPFPQGSSPRGQPYNPNVVGCVPLPDFETLTNPNF